MRHALGQKQRHARTDGGRHRANDDARLGSGCNRTKHEDEHAARFT